MSKSFTLTIPGTPVAQPRHRISTRGGKVRTYLPKDNPVHAFKEAIALAASQCGFFNPPVEVSIVAWFPMPASWSQKKRTAMDGKRHTQKPDADNVSKAVKDALRGVWKDDCVVSDDHTLKRWTSGTGLTEIRVSEIQEDVGDE